MGIWLLGQINSEALRISLNFSLLQVEQLEIKHNSPHSLSQYCSFFQTSNFLYFFYVHNYLALVAFLFDSEATRKQVVREGEEM